MYNASRLYWDKIKEQNRLFELMVRIEHEGGTLNLSDKDIELGSFKVIDSSQTGEDFTIGGTVASHLEFTLVNKEKFENIKLIGAKVIPTIRLQLRGPIDAHFLQASQPSKIEGFQDQWEHIPLGQFNIDIADRLRKTIEVKAIDNMILLDKSYALSTIKYPATLGRILNDVCSIAGVGTPVGNFVNSDYTVGTRPEGDYTLRNIVAFIAELSGSFAKFDRNGRLSMKWYEETDIEITSHQRVNFEQSDYEIQITGLRFDSKEKDEEDNHVTYLVGSDDYRVDLTGNVLLQDDYNIVLPKILENIENTKFAPYSADWQGNPAIDVGDILVHVDLDGVRHKTVVTNNEYVYRGVSKMAAKGLPSISRGFKSGDNRIASIIGRVESEFSSELSNLQQEQLMATELIGNMLGGHVSHVTEKDELKYNKFGNGIFIHDAPDLMDSIKIWKWGIGGFGYSDDGGETYMTGVTIDGSIVANIVSANHINTGTLSSNKGNSWISMDTGEFELGGMKLIDNEFSLSLGDIDLDGNMISDTITNINSSIDGVETTVKKYADDGIINAESRINQTINSIESSVKSYADDLVSDSETSIMQTVNSISSTVSTINANYATKSQITQLSGQITSKVSSTDFTGYKVASMISQSPSGISLIASKITLSADNIDLDGITRVNQNLKIGTRNGVLGRVDFNDASYIRTINYAGHTLELGGIEIHHLCNQLYFKTLNIHYREGVNVHNAPYMTPYATESLGYHIDYSPDWNQIIVRRKGSSTILGRINLT